MKTDGDLLYDPLTDVTPQEGSARSYRYGRQQAVSLAVVLLGVLFLLALALGYLAIPAVASWTARNLINLVFAVIVYWMVLRLIGWQLWLDRMEQLHRKTGKPILITEIGYRSVDGAGMSPYDFRSAGDPDPGEQADLYWGAIEAMAHAQWIEGMFWWNVQPGGPVDLHNTQYSPLGRLKKSSA